MLVFVAGKPVKLSVLGHSSVTALAVKFTASLKFKVILPETSIAALLGELLNKVGAKSTCKLGLNSLNAAVLEIICSVSLRGVVQVAVA